MLVYQRVYPIFRHPHIAATAEEMALFNPEVRRRTDALDAAGNTTAAIGKALVIHCDSSHLSSNRRDTLWLCQKVFFFTIGKP